MPEVTYILGDGAPVTLEVPSDSTLLAAPLGLAIRMKYGCKLARCGKCVVSVLEGAHALSPPGPDEVRKLGPRLEQGMRLACQARARGPCVLRQEWVRMHGERRGGP